MTWFSKAPDRERAGLWEQETVEATVAGTNCSKNLGMGPGLWAGVRETRRRPLGLIRPLGP